MLFNGEGEEGKKSIEVVPGVQHPERAQPPSPRKDDLADLFPGPFYTLEQARAEGFLVLSGPYAVPQRWMARRVVEDLRRDPEIEIRLVKRPRGVEIWIKPSARQRAAVRKEEPLSCFTARRLKLFYQLKNREEELP